MSTMKIDIKHIQEFENGLNPQYPEKSKIPAQIVGYGEISSIFKIQPYHGWVFKRLPLFTSHQEAEIYIKKYNTYVNYLKKAGISLPKDDAFIVKGKKVVLYLAQEALNKGDLCQNKLQKLPPKKALKLIENIFKEIKKIAEFNNTNAEISLSIDGQISNWAEVDNNLIYFDTSTPLFKIKSVEQLNPELLLNSTPRALRWLIRKFFLQEVMDRYYNLRLIYVDLIANLYKEKKTELISDSINLANNLLPKNAIQITAKEITKYYQDDKFIWQLFLALRRLDRWLTNRVFRKQYEYILPGKIER